MFKLVKVGLDKVKAILRGSKWMEDKVERSKRRKGWSVLWAELRPEASQPSMQHNFRFRPRGSALGVKM